MNALHPLVITLSLAAALLAAPYSPTAEKGDAKVETLLADWTDAARADRKVPVKIYYPAAAGGLAGKACPIVIFSHGLGGTRTGYEAHGSFWASHGYISVHLQHLGSDDSVWRDVPLRDRMAAMRRATMDAGAIMNRIKDVRFAIDTLETLNKDDKSPLHARLDLDKIAMAGHSFGAWTTLAVGGLSLGRLGPTGLDKRIKALIPMSAPAVKDESSRSAAYARITLPALHMTGTHDDSPVNDTVANDRRVPFDYAPSPQKGGADSYLIIFDGGDHMVFGGRSGAGAGLLAGLRESDTKKDPVFHKIIHQSSLAFLDAYLRGNADAKKWLQDEAGLKAALGKDGTLEMKK
jgi:pimeloyl-ACP methyl ester carboxylesterase